MNHQLSQIKQTIESLIDISDKEWEYYSAMFRVKKLKRKEILLQAPDICTNIFFVNKGLLRIYFIDNDGNEATFHFSLENNFAADYESFLMKTPSNYTIEAMEETEVVLMSNFMVNDGYEKLRFGEKLGRLLAEKYFFIFSRKMQNIYTKPPYERLLSMNEQFPGIRQRVPQHYIASYLNITPVHLSRLINKN